MDKFTKHEALDRAFMVLDIFGSYVMENRFIEKRTKLNEAAVRAHNALYDLYQAVGAEIDNGRS